MTQVASVRSVLGPARQLAPWWDADQIGKPLTPLMAFWVRALPRWRHELPGTVARALARRGLLQRDAGIIDLTPAGQTMKDTLGSIPLHLLEDRYRALPDILRRRLDGPTAHSLGPLDTSVICQECGAFTPAELIAWNHTTRACLTCATKEPS